MSSFWDLQDRASIRRLEPTREAQSHGLTRVGVARVAANAAGPSGSDAKLYLDLVLLNNLGCWLSSRGLWSKRVAGLWKIASLKLFGASFKGGPKQQSTSGNSNRNSNSNSNSNTWPPQASNFDCDQFGVVEFPDRKQDSNRLKSSKIRLIVQLVAIKLVTLTTLHRIAQTSNDNINNQTADECSPILLTTLISSFLLMYHYYEQYYCLFLASVDELNSSSAS